MRHFVSRKIVSVVKAFVAVGTFEKTLVSVYEDVAYESSLLFETLAADFAFERSFAGMQSLVRREILFDHETFGTKRAFEWAVVGVTTLMSFKIVF